MNHDPGELILFEDQIDETINVSQKKVECVEDYSVII